MMDSNHRAVVGVFAPLRYVSVLPKLVSDLPAASLEGDPVEGPFLSSAPSTFATAAGVPQGGEDSPKD
jgi:hypothetical protein